MILQGIAYTYRVLDAIDDKLMAEGEPRLSRMIELANLSSVIGNVLGSGIAKASEGVFRRNGPHKYPDLLSQEPGACDVEIKVALEANSPKGHLAKPGCYATCRYVLCDANGRCELDTNKRGDVAWIWEIRFGWLEKADFSVSSTEGDSGKTAVIKSQSLLNLVIVYIDLDRCPYPRGGRRFKQYSEAYSP